MTLTQDEYNAVTEYEQETGRQVIYPVVNRNEIKFASYNTDVNVWYAHDARGRAEYNDDGSYQNIFQTATEENIADGNYMVVDGSGNLDENGEYVVRRYTKKNDGATYEVRALYSEWYLYQNGFEASFLFGVDSFGKDILVCLASGARLSFALSIGVSIINLAIGLIYGSIEGYYGGKVDFDYTTIDVIASSPRTTVRYYVLTNEQFTAEEYDYNNTDVEEELFMEVSTSSDYRLLRDQYTYVPGLTDAGIEQNDEGYSTYGLVKVCLYVRDTTSSRARTDYVFMDWYVPAEYKVDISQIKGTASTASSTFIMMASDGRGATYGDDTVTDLESYKQYIARVQEDYQAKIDESIANGYPDGLYASSETNLYLPDFSGYVTDNLGGYTDLEYAIYYRSSSNGSSTGLASDELAMTVSQADVTYRFTIYVTDAAGNDMYYPDENGELVTISADDVWEDDYAELLPFFEVTVDYRAATVEEPGVQNVGYVGSTYNSASFEIKGVDATYSAVYNLYIFDRDAFYGDTGVELSYNDVVDNAYALFYNEYKDFENTRQYFTLVTDEEEYEDYEWNSTNVTFVPQDPSMFYVVRLTLTDTGLSNKVTNSFLVVRASERAAELYGEDNWVENNIAAIVLFCVAGVFLVAFVALLIIKPKDKGDIDVIAEQLAEDKKSKKAK